MNKTEKEYKWELSHSFKCDKCNKYIYVTAFAYKYFSTMLGAGTSLGGALMAYHKFNNCIPFTQEDMEAHGIKHPLCS